MKRWFCCALLMACAAMWAQTPTPDLHPAVPTVTFDLLWEAVRPQEFIVTVKASGPASYLSHNPLATLGPGEKRDPDYVLEFTISSASQRRIFQLAEQAKFFNGNFEYTRHAVANTGRKTLTYADPARHFQTVFNYSENKPIQELAHLFQSISNTIEYGRKLQFKHKYDKLGLEDELKSMEDAADSHNLAEMHVIAPALRSIADDRSVLNIARERAMRLLKKAENP